VFGFLAAFLPLTRVLLWPVQEWLLIPALAGGTDFPSAMAAVLTQPEREGVSGWRLLTTLLVFVMVTGLFVYVGIQITLAFRVIHQLSLWRVVGALLIALAAYLVFSTVFISPLVGNIYRALAPGH
jgi:hypothetical protein